jgi:Dyp-type peroxidase family
MFDPDELELHDIQGLVVRGFGALASARFLVLEVADEARARAYLRERCGRINRARDTPGEVALQVAFTAAGLERLGVPASALITFAREFLEGMDDDVRSAGLGDRGDNDPSTWQWGQRTEPVHALLMIYAADEPTLEIALAAELDGMAGGFRVLHHKPTARLNDLKEHFGWRDGLSMPKIAGVKLEQRPRKKRESWTGPIPAGEFVLGYRNDYGAFTESPTVEPADDPDDHLALDRDGRRKSLGRNGTYLVFREMTQHVVAFWDYLERQSREPGSDPVSRAIALGAKMVGRWPGGAPLVESPDEDLPGLSHRNEFRYEGDRIGLRCPPGAHIRRSNPRDALAVADRGHATSILMVRKHQMIRRGRPFGRPISEAMDPREILAARGAPDGEHRGLHFICLVGNISRQFEFVQRSWIDSANFDSMYRDGDPIAAARRPAGHPNANDEMTCPAEPVRRRYTRMPQFTRLVGGAYFFLPGIAALRFISRHPPP